MKAATAVIVLVAAFATAPLVGCSQKEGKSCQTTSDCDKGLACCFDGAGSVIALGVCATEQDCYPIDAAVDAATQLDAAVQQDAELQQDAEISQDASVTQDASP